MLKTEGMRKTENRVPINLRAMFFLNDGTTTKCTRTISANGNPFQIEFNKTNRTFKITELDGAEKEESKNAGGKVSVPCIRKARRRGACNSGRGDNLAARPGRGFRALQRARLPAAKHQAHKWLHGHAMPLLRRRLGAARNRRRAGSAIPNQLQESNRLCCEQRANLHGIRDAAPERPSGLP